MQHELFIEKSENIKWLKKKHEKSQDVLNRTLRIVDLFSGCGGLSFGVLSAAIEAGLGAECVFAIDVNKAPLAVFKNNIPHVENSVIQGDILEYLEADLDSPFTEKELNLKAKVGNVDVLVAGPPCQGHSDLNNISRRNDPRNKLYLACNRAIELFNPRLVIIENVPTVVHSTERVVQITEKRLKKGRYFSKSLVLSFLDLGIPQSRKRHVLIASRDKDFVESIVKNESKIQTPVLGEFIQSVDRGEGLMYTASKSSHDNVRRINYLFDNDLLDLPDHMRPSCHRDKAHSYKSVYGRLRYDAPAQTLTSGYGSMGQGRYIHPQFKRTINSREAARIQGFPDRFSFDGVRTLSDLRQMVANAVPPQLTYIVTKYFISLDHQKA